MYNHHKGEHHTTTKVDTTMGLIDNHVHVDRTHDVLVMRIIEEDAYGLQSHWKIKSSFILFKMSKIKSPI